jgi:F-type H+-transporting ATPase subunit b
MNNLYQSLVAVEPATLIVTICNLFIQMFVVKKFFLSKVLAILDKRREAADEQIVAAQQAKDEAVAIKETYEANMRQAREEASQILSSAQKNAVASSEEIIGQAKAEAAQLKEKAAADIARDKKNALNEAKDEISGIAMAIAEKVVERQLTQNDQDNLVSEFIDQLGDAL